MLTPRPGTPGAQTPRRPDDLSGDAHRQVIGYLGLLLPAALFALAAARPSASLDPWTLLDSISAYYYTGANAVFVGVLAALGLYLLTYRGYDNPRGRADRLVSRIAGSAALLVAVFPTAPPGKVPAPVWWDVWVGRTHYAGAVVLFSMFAVLSLWLFRTTASATPPRDKVRRNRIYLGCGLLIVAGMTWAGIAGWLGGPIFLPEALAIGAFAVSWLTKGRALETLRKMARRAPRVLTSSGANPAAR